MLSLYDKLVRYLNDDEIEASSALKKDCVDQKRKKKPGGTNSIISNSIFIRHNRNHFYRVPSLKASSYQAKIIDTISVTEEGLLNLKKAFDNVHAVPSFIYRLLGCDSGSKDFQALLLNPKCFPYFKEEKFLLIPNLPYDPQFETGTHSHSQKMKDNGISLCAWFIHPDLSCVDAQLIELLEELSQEHPPQEGVIAKLRREMAGGLLASSISGQREWRDPKTIGELKQSGEYLASILDLNRGHVPFLMQLKEKVMLHLKKQYWVNESDFVNLYFHLLYSEETVTLHLHVRVNQAFHPSEKSYAVTLEQTIEWLQSGKTMLELVLKKQSENNGQIRKSILPDDEPYYHVPGITIHKDVVNEYRISACK